MRSIFSALAFVAAAWAQSLSFISPTIGQNIASGSTIQFEIAVESSSSSVTEMGIALLLQHCQEDPCEDVATTDGLGVPFFVGNFEVNEVNARGMPVMVFSATIPTIEAGLAVISLPHAALIGADASFFTEIVNNTIFLE